jgi:hypothetical protein
MISKPTIVALSQLIRTGEAQAASLAAIPGGQSLGMWTASSDGARAVATPALIELLSRLPDEHEVLIGLASCSPKLRTAWQAIIAARLHEPRRAPVAVAERMNPRHVKVGHHRLEDRIHQLHPFRRGEVLAREPFAQPFEQKLAVLRWRAAIDVPDDD